jgi:threonine/homoserine/homoserine lactone efflux protein
VLLDSTRFLLFAGASLTLLFTPGPVVLYVMARSLSQGTRAGLLSVLGAEVGNAVHVLASALGLAALVASSALAFAAVKYLGAAYLAYLGICKLVAPADAGPAQKLERALAPGRAIFGQAVLVAVLNPKTALFFLAFLPQFVDPHRGAPVVQVLLLGGTFVGLAVLSDGAYALLAGKLGQWLWRHPSFTRGERWVSAAIYFGLSGLAVWGGPGPHTHGS